MSKVKEAIEDKIEEILERENKTEHDYPYIKGHLELLNKACKELNTVWLILHDDNDYEILL